MVRVVDGLRVSSGLPALLAALTPRQACCPSVLGFCLYSSLPVPRAAWLHPSLPGGFCTSHQRPFLPVKLCPFLTPPPPLSLAWAPLLCHTSYHLSSDVFIRCLRFHLRPVPVHILDWKSSEGGPGPRVSHTSLFHCLDLTDLQ